MLCRGASVHVNSTLEHMKTFAALLAFGFAIPLSLLLIGSARLYSFWRASSAAIGKVTSVQERKWIDDETYPTTRYFASVQYVAAGSEHMIIDWGPHKEPPAIDDTVAIRYR